MSRPDSSLSIQSIQQKFDSCPACENEVECGHSLNRLSDFLPCLKISRRMSQPDSIQSIQQQKSDSCPACENGVECSPSLNRLSDFLPCLRASCQMSRPDSSRSIQYKSDSCPACKMKSKLVLACLGCTVGPCLP